MQDLEKVRSLLNQGADVNARRHYNPTPLYLTVNKGHIGIARLLINKKANVNVQDRNGYALLHFAAEEGHIGVVKLLLKNEANVNVKSDHGFFYPRLEDEGGTPLQSAVESGCMEILFLLLLHGADISTKNRQEINNNPEFANCLAEFEQIKVTPHLGGLMKAYKSGDTKAISQYINKDSAKNQEALIQEFKTVKERCTNEQLSFIPECVLGFVKRITLKFLKSHTDNKKAIKLLLESKGGIKVTKAVLVDSQVTGKTKDEYVRLPDEIIQEISSYLNLNELNFDNVLLALSKKADTFLTKLKEVVHGAPSKSLDKTAAEPASKHQYVEM